MSKDNSTRRQIIRRFRIRRPGIDPTKLTAEQAMIELRLDAIKMATLLYDAVFHPGKAGGKADDSVYLDQCDKMYNYAAFVLDHKGLKTDGQVFNWVKEMKVEGMPDRSLMNLVLKNDGAILIPRRMINDFEDNGNVEVARALRKRLERMRAEGSKRHMRKQANATPAT